MASPSKAAAARKPALPASRKPAATRTATGRTAPAKPGAARQAAAKSGTAKAGTRTTAASRGRYSRYSRAQPQPRRVYSQQAPSPDRYKEIQQALIQKGYLQGEASGSWGPESTQALQRFQQDQNLKADGKLDSLSLIALGLGPKRSMSAQARPEPPPARP